MNSLAVSRALRVVACLACLVAAAGATAGKFDHKLDASLQALRAEGAPDRVKVIVVLAVDSQASRANSAGERSAAIAMAGDAALAVLPAGSYRVERRWESVAGMVIEIDSSALDALATAPQVLRIGDDMGAGAGNMEQSLPLTGFDDVASVLGYTGAGTRVAVLDSGYDTDHPDLLGSLIGQACFAEGGAACPGGAGAAEDDVGHGSGVAGVITGNGVVAATGGARDSEIFAVKVLDSNNSFSATQYVVDGLNFVINSGIEFDAVNMSLGTNAGFAGDCDNAAAFTMVLADAVDTLRAMGTLSVVSTGNQGNTNAMQAPACVASSISVGASHDGGAQNNPACASTTVDTATCYSNASATTDIFAPGSEIRTANHFGGTSNWHGTSFSAPTVSACVAAMRQANPSLTPDQIEAALESTASVQIAAGGRNFGRLDCFAATASVDLASQTTWYLDGVAFDDGGTASGSFVFDTATGSYSAIDITTRLADGSASNTYLAPLPVSPGNSTILIAVPDAGVPDLTGSPLLALIWLSELTDAGGTRDADASGGGFAGEGTCVNSGCSTNFARRIARGRVVAADAYVESVRWYLDGVTFDDGASARGSFQFNRDAQLYAGIDVRTSQGSQAAAAIYHDLWPVFPGFDRAARFVPNASLPSLDGEPLLFMDWQTPLTGAGGIKNIDLDGFSEENIMCAADGNCWFTRRLIDAGRAVAPQINIKHCNLSIGAAIPDGDPVGISNDLSLPFAGSIIDLNVGLLTDHTFVGDLIYTLEHVDTGTSVTLIDRPGVPTTQFGCGENNVDLLLDDEGTAPVEGACDPSPLALGGALMPAVPLATFDGQDLAGTWRLNVSDNELQDTGTLREFCVYATVIAGPIGQDIDGDGTADADDNCVLVANNQTDADNDGFGNACDGDLNNDCIVNAGDLGVLRAAFFSTPALPNWNPGADLNDNGVVNAQDLGLMRTLFFTVPGLSGVPNICQ